MTFEVDVAVDYHADVDAHLYIVTLRIEDEGAAHFMLRFPDARQFAIDR